MGTELQLPFKVGQLAEAKSFLSGFRGAWFRCKIKEISRKRGQWNALLEYFDYPDEKVTSTKLYQVPPYHSKENRQLMLRPQYPTVKLKNEVSDVGAISDAIVVSEGVWHVGDLVDWWANGCYWSGQLTNLLGGDKAMMTLTPPPMGEGAAYEVSVKDIRPSLDWSPDFGWTVPMSQDRDSTRQCAQLIQPVNQALGRFPVLEVHSTPMSEERNDYQATAGFSPYVSLSANSDGKKDLKTAELIEPPVIIDLPKDAANTSKGMHWSNINESGSCSGVDAEKPAGATENLHYSNCALNKFRTSSGIKLHSMSCDSMEAAIMDLEELATKIKWLKEIINLGRPLSDADRPSWKFVEHRAALGKK